MREIIFDTETTGFDPESGDRIVEIGCVEMVNQALTGEAFHVYINPERDMPQSAFEVHGLSTEFLSDKPLFSDVADDFVSFVGDNSKLVAHNASFDMKFVNAELAMLGKEIYPFDRVIDTLQIARRKHPMGPNSLDALCSRYNVDNSARTKHGALLDAEILAEVYIELLGGKQRGFDLDMGSSTGSSSQGAGRRKAKQRPKALPSRLDEEALASHKAFVDSLGDDTLWHKVWQAN